jgi:hypothetical protein
MIRQSQEGDEPVRQPYNDTDEGWRQVVEVWQIPTGDFENEDDLDPVDFFEPEDLPT